jgi:hypothetical protein
MERIGHGMIIKTLVFSYSETEELLEAIKGALALDLPFIAHNDDQGDVILEIMDEVQRNND